MNRAKTAGTAFAVLLSMVVFGPSAAGEDLSLKAVVQKNIEASGGKDKLNQVRNLTFKTGNSQFVVSASGDMKRSIGQEPVVSEVLLVEDGQARRNYFGAITELSDPERTVYLIWAKLYAGLFSLIRFEE